MTHTNPNVVQASFAAFEDDGGLGAATQIGSNNQNWTQDTDSNFRVHFDIDENAGGAANNQNLTLYYSTDGTTYNVVTTSTPVQLTGSGNVSDGTAITTANDHFATLTVNGEFDSNGTVNNVSFAANDNTEMAYNLTIDSAQVADEDTLYLRVYTGGSPLDGYTNTPVITVNEPVTHSGSGTPAAQAASASGSGEITKTGSGTPQAQAADVDGSGNVVTEVTGSGTPASQDATADGSGEITKTGSGTPASQDSTASGAGEITKTGSGTPTAQDATAAGAGEITKTGSGTPQAQDAQVAGAGFRTAIGSGDPQAQAATADGEGTVGNVVTGSGTPAAQDAAASGAGERIVTGTGTPAAQDAAASGAGEITKTGSGTPQAQDATASGAGIRTAIGSGDPQAQAATVVGSGTIEGTVTGSGVLNAGPATVSGVGTVGGEQPAQVYPPGGGGKRKTKTPKDAIYEQIAAEDEMLMTVIIAYMQEAA